MKQKHLVSILFIICLYSTCALMVIAGCQNTDRRVTSAIGLKTTKDIFIATATTAKRLCEQGVLSESDCATIESSYTRGRQLLLDAKILWDSMVLTDTFHSNEDYDELLMAVTRITAVIENTIRKDDQ